MNRKLTQGIVRLSTLLVIAASIMWSCDKGNFEEESQAFQEKENVNLNSTVSVKTDISDCDPVVNILYAGQAIDVGTIKISNDDDYLYVEYETKDGWVLKHTHLFVGDKNDVPTTKKGSPKIGLFTYQEAHSPYVTYYKYSISLDDIEECFVVAAHAETLLLNDNSDVIQEETAWGDGDRFVDNGSWATFYEFCISDCNPCVIEPVVFDFYGGQTILVGDVTVVNDELNLYVTFNTTDNYYLHQTHLFVGQLADLPLNNANTPIPGQFPYKVDPHDPVVQTHTYTIALDDINDVEGCYIIAAHASVKEIIDGVEQGAETAWSFGTEFPGSNRWGWYSEYCTQICAD